MSHRFFDQVILIGFLGAISFGWLAHRHQLSKNTAAPLSIEEIERAYADDKSLRPAYWYYVNVKKLADAVNDISFSVHTRGFSETIRAKRRDLFCLTADIANCGDSLIESLEPYRELAAEADEARKPLPQIWEDRHTNRLSMQHDRDIYESTMHSYIFRRDVAEAAEVHLIRFIERSQIHFSEERVASQLVNPEIRATIRRPDGRSRLNANFVRDLQAAKRTLENLPELIDNWRQAHANACHVRYDSPSPVDAGPEAYQANTAVLGALQAVHWNLFVLMQSVEDTKTELKNFDTALETLIAKPDPEGYLKIYNLSQKIYSSNFYTQTQAPYFVGQVILFIVLGYLLGFFCSTWLAARLTP